MGRPYGYYFRGSQTLNQFEAWNLRLLQNFFPAGSSGGEVFLGATPEELDRIGVDLGGDAGFLKAVREGPSWPLPAKFEDRVRLLVEQRTRTARRGPSYVDPRQLDPGYHPRGQVERSAPTYLPYLAALARAAAASGGDGYYARLRADLALPANWSAQNMGRIVHAWEDLQAWTRATEGAFGTFNVRRLGGFVHVGLPKSQVILTSGDIPAIHALFRSLGIEAGTPLSQAQRARMLAALRVGDHRVSRALAQAAREAAYSGELEAILVAIHETWDGRPTGDGGPRRSCHDEGGDGPAREAALGLYVEGALPWRLQVRFAGGPALQLDGDADVEGWRPRRLQDGEVVLSHVNGPAKEILTCLPFRSELQGVAWRLPRRPIWVLGREGGSLFELWETGLSPYGNVFLLADEQGASVLGEYLERANPRYEEVDTSGLPPGWRMVWLEEQSLTDDQLSLPQVRSTGRICRLVGGTSVTIGGSRHYLHYDLPRVLVSGPTGSVPSCNGVPLRPFPGEPQAPPVEGVPMARPVASFELPDFVEQGGVFSIEVFEQHGPKLPGGTTLRVKDPEALPLEAGSAGYGVDPHGRPIPVSGDGLGTPFDSMNAECQAGTFLEAPEDADLLAHDDSASGSWETNPAARFLDALATARRMSYGRAKALLGRLLSGGNAPVEPWRLLEDLRARGHVELERSGAAPSYVHAAPPALYELPIRIGRSRLYGLAGTIAFAQWRTLGALSLGCKRLVQFSRSKGDPTHAAYLPVLRLQAFFTADELRMRAAQTGIAVLPPMALRMARWSVGMRDVRSGLMANSSPLPPRDEAAGIRVFDAEVGRFKYWRGGFQRPEGQQLLLYEYEDPKVPGSRGYVLAHRQGFSRVHDLRWARWLAVVGSAAAPSQGWREIVPASKGRSGWDVWVPASLRFPAVIERALVLCKGCPPDERQMDAGREDGGRLDLIFARSRHAPGIRVDASTFAGMATGRWLVYEGVPDDVLRVVRGRFKETW